MYLVKIKADKVTPHFGADGELAAPNRSERREYVIQTENPFMACELAWVHAQEDGLHYIECESLEQG